MLLFPQSNYYASYVKAICPLVVFSTYTILNSKICILSHVAVDKSTFKSFCRKLGALVLWEESWHKSAFSVGA